MRKFLASVAVGAAALCAYPAIAADLGYPPPEVPPVDYGMGSFYLRGSAALNWHWAPTVYQPNDPDPNYVNTDVATGGYGYSWGAGFGYETGTGLRFDGTIDSLETSGLKITKVGSASPDVDGDYVLMLRSTLALANVYYDFNLGGGGLGMGYTGGGGAFGYVGLGAGVAWNHAEVNSPAAATYPVQTGGNVSAAGAVMAGVGYDMGSWVADVGYRGVYIDEINNSPTDASSDPNYYEIHNNWINEVRGTVRYRFN